jgi:hypothetical protein
MQAESKNDTAQGLEGMRYGITLAGFLIFGLAFTGTAKDKIYLTIRAISHTDEVRSTTSQRISPGSANTNCSSSATGSATTLGNITAGTAAGTTNCRTTSTPPRVRQVTSSIRDVSNIVEAND